MADLIRKSDRKYRIAVAWAQDPNTLGSVYKAIEDGFARAWLSIRDSNVSSLITTLILYMFGTPAIKGFAIALSIGILISMFSAITATRTFLAVLMTKRISKIPWLFGVKIKKPSAEETK